MATATFVVLEVIRRWDDLAAIVEGAHLGWVVLATATFGIAEVAYAAAWPATLRRMGHPVDGRRAAATFLVAQTAKFVPGGIWPAVGRVGTADRIGVGKREVTAGWTIETSASVAAAVLVGGLGGAGGTLLTDDPGAGLRVLEAGIAVGLFVAVALTGRSAANRIAGRAVLSDRGLVAILAWHLVVWTTYGLAAGTLAVSLDGPFWPTVSAFTLAWVAGLLVIGAPAGLGVREAVMTAALTPAAGATTALAIAVGSRAVWTVVQLVAAAVALPNVARPDQAADDHGSATPIVPC